MIKSIFPSYSNLLHPTLLASATPLSIIQRHYSAPLSSKSINLTHATLCTLRFPLLFFKNFLHYFLVSIVIWVYLSFILPQLYSIRFLYDTISFLLFQFNQLPVLPSFCLTKLMKFDIVSF